MTTKLPDRVLLVIPKQSSYRFFLEKLGISLANMGVEVHCACAIENRIQAKDTIIFHDLPMPRGMNPVAHRQCSRQLDYLITGIKPDIVHAHFSASIFTVALGKQKHWPAVIGTFQGLRFPLEKSRVMMALFRRAEIWSISRLQGSWVVTNDDLQAALHYGPASKVFRQPGYGFGCELDRFDRRKFDRQFMSRFRAELGFAPADVVFVFVGRFVDFKGFALVIRAFLQLRKTNLHARLLLVGERDPIHPTGLSASEEEELQHAADIVDVGHQPTVERYLSISDVMVFPSEREGVPVCLMEALAMGVPVITRDSRGCRDVVRHGIDGLVLTDCTVANLCAAMHELAQNDSQRVLFSENAVSARDRFDRAHYVDVQMEIYRALGAI